MEILLLTESDSFEQLFAEIDFNTNYPNEEIAEVINPSPENIASTNIFNLETEQEDSFLATPILAQDNIIRKIQKDFTTKHIDPLIRISPLSPSLLDEQMDEIITRLSNGTYIKNRDKQIRTLEACYYLETLRIAHCNNFLKLKEINQTLRNKLGQRKANNISITAERISKLLNLCGKEKLYSTRYVTLSNLHRLTNDNFLALFEALRTHGVHF